MLFLRPQIAQLLRDAAGYKPEKVKVPSSNDSFPSLEAALRSMKIFNPEDDNFEKSTYFLDTMNDGELFSKWRKGCLQLFGRVLEVEKAEYPTLPLSLFSDEAQDFFTDYQLKEKPKFVIVGPSGSGKSALINWYVA
eukprot:TRINITY_DN10199_c0_g1_i1.p1 TRINITY_DN10199_c0_g1~~TRINITY_DN10199_c0_g1_i1.p1  ORF type:complete len:137 (-),score=19.47 TRINITY_DN10199_c0_g1_i1:114-524(-)